MAWKDVAGAVKDGAPFLASVLAMTGVGAPAAAAVEAAGKIAARALGTDESPEAVDAALRSDPEALAKVRQAELDNAFHLQQLANDARSADLNAQVATLQAQLADVKSARDREASVRDSTNRVLAYSVIGAFIAMVGATLLGAAQVDGALAGTLVGYLSAKAEQVLAYYFGSTAGSARKTELLAQSTPADAGGQVGSRG